MLRGDTAALVQFTLPSLRFPRPCWLVVDGASAERGRGGNGTREGSIQRRDARSRSAAVVTLAKTHKYIAIPAVMYMYRPDYVYIPRAPAVPHGTRKWYCTVPFFSSRGVRKPARLSVRHATSRQPS